LKQPNFDLAIELLAAGRDARALRRFADFPNLRAARAFMRSPEVQVAVSERMADQLARLGAKAIQRLDQLLSDPETENRVVVVAARAVLEASGIIRKATSPPTRHVAELSVAELQQLIDRTQREIEALRALPVS
jgi:hypothetical protein